LINRIRSIEVLNTSPSSFYTTIDDEGNQPPSYISWGNCELYLTFYMKQVFLGNKDI
jgi:hypothetical protein